MSIDFEKIKECNTMVEAYATDMAKACGSHPIDMLLSATASLAIEEYGAMGVAKVAGKNFSSALQAFGQRGSKPAISEFIIGMIEGFRDASCDPRDAANHMQNLLGCCSIATANANLSHEERLAFALSVVNDAYNKIK